MSLPSKSLRRPQRQRPPASIVLYRPDHAVRRGYRSAAGDILRELWENRWLTLQLFKRDLLAFYKQSLLGALWIVFVPLVTVGTFVVLKGSGVVAVGQLDAPYPVFATLGVAIWQLFAQGVVSGANSLVAGGEMITRINFSKKSLVIASMGRTVVSFGVLLVLAGGLYGFYALQGQAPALHAAAWLAPLALLPTLVLTLGLSFYLALLNSIVRDIATGLSVLLTFLLLLTPVLYARPLPTGDAGDLSGLLGAITDYNPLHYLVAAPRELVLRGTVTEVEGFVVATALSLALFVLGLFSFHLTETRIAERI